MVGPLDCAVYSGGGHAHRLGRRIRAIFHRARVRAGDPGLVTDTARVRRGGRAGVEAADSPAPGESHRRAAAAYRVGLADDLRYRRIFLQAARIKAIAPDQA